MSVHEPRKSEVGVGPVGKIFFLAKCKDFMPTSLPRYNSTLGLCV